MLGWGRCQGFEANRPQEHTQSPPGWGSIESKRPLWPEPGLVSLAALEFT